MQDLETAHRRQGNSPAGSESTISGDCGSGRFMNLQQYHPPSNSHDEAMTFVLPGC